MWYTEGWCPAALLHLKRVLVNVKYELGNPSQPDSLLEGRVIHTPSDQVPKLKVCASLYQKRNTTQDKTDRAEGVIHMSKCSPKCSWLELFLELLRHGSFKFYWLLSVCSTELMLFKQRTLFLAPESQESLSSLFVESIERPLFSPCLITEKKKTTQNQKTTNKLKKPRKPPNHHNRKKQTHTKKPTNKKTHKTTNT